MYRRTCNFKQLPPAIHKAILFDQFRSEVVAGYDKANGTPVFLATEDFNDYEYLYQCHFFKGKVYRFTETGNMQPVKNNKGRLLQFTGYSKDDPDTMHVLTANFR